MKVSQSNAKRFFKAEYEYTREQKFLNLILLVPLIIQGVALYYGIEEKVVYYAQIAISGIGFLLLSMSLQSLNTEGRGVWLKLLPIIRKDSYKLMLKLQYVSYLGAFFALIISYFISGFNSKVLAMALELNGVTLSLIAVGGLVSNSVENLKNISLKIKIIAYSAVLIIAIFAISVGYIFATLDGGIRNIVVGVALNVLFSLIIIIDVKLSGKKGINS